jgi:hypothetical protein
VFLSGLAGLRSPPDPRLQVRGRYVSEPHPFDVVPDFSCACAARSHQSGFVGFPGYCPILPRSLRLLPCFGFCVVTHARGQGIGHGTQPTYSLRELVIRESRPSTVGQATQEQGRLLGQYAPVLARRRLPIFKSADEPADGWLTSPQRIESR